MFAFIPQIQVRSRRNLHRWGHASQLSILIWSKCFVGCPRTIPRHGKEEKECKSLIDMPCYLRPVDKRSRRDYTVSLDRSLRSRYQIIDSWGTLVNEDTVWFVREMVTDLQWFTAAMKVSGRHIDWKIQEHTVKLTSNRSSSEKPNPAQCGFSNRKPTPIHTIPTSTFCSFRARIFDFSANICYFEEFDSFNAETSSSQFYIFFRELCVRIYEVLKRFWKMKVNWERENVKNFRWLLILYRDDERSNFNKIKRRLI